MESEEKKNKNWIVVLGVVLILITIIGIVGYSIAPKTILLEESELFDKETVIQKAYEVIDLVSNDEHRILLDNYADEKLAEEVSITEIQDAKDSINPTWGTMIEIVKENYYEVGQSDTNYAMAIVDVGYENVTITYTLTFDIDMKLAGIYIK